MYKQKEVKLTLNKKCNLFSNLFARFWHPNQELSVGKFSSDFGILTNIVNKYCEVIKQSL